MVGYIISLIVLNIILFVGVIIILKKPLHHIMQFDTIFVSAIFLLYSATFFIQLFTFGADDKLFLNTLPITNISPFVFFTLPLCLINKKLAHCIFCIVPLLSVGIICSVEISHFRFIHDDIAFSIALSLDGLAHVLYALFGIYLVVSRQIMLNVKNFCLGCGIMMGIVASMLTLNLIFHTSFFGLNMYGKHNIYEIILCNNSIISATIYLTGLLVFLLLGYLFQLLNFRINKQFNS